MSASTPETLKKRAAMFSIAVALLLVAAKLWASIATGSVAMLGSLGDSALDLAASVITLVGIAYAAVPADDDHRFGHGKAEAIAALVQTLLITLSALLIGWSAVQRIADPKPTDAAIEGIAVSVGAIIVTLLLLSYQRRVIRHTGSLAIAADNLHYRSDLLLNLSVIAALALDRFLGWRLADPLFGLAIAAWLMLGAWRGASSIFHELMDREWDEAHRQRLICLLADRYGVYEPHELKTRTSGGQDFVQLHIRLDPDMKLAVVHDIMDRIADDVRGLFPTADVLIHPDPKGLHEPGERHDLT